MNWRTIYKENLTQLMVALLIILLCTIFILYPRSTKMEGVMPEGIDPAFMLWTMNWVQHQLLTDPLHLYRANIFYPHHDSLAYSDSLITQSLITLPVRLFNTEPTVIFNMAYLLAYVMAGWFMYILIKELTGSFWISLLAGFLFAFSPYRLDTLSHLQYSSHQWLPLVIWAIVKFFKTEKTHWAFLASAFLLLQALSTAYYLFMFSLPLVILLASLIHMFRPTKKQILAGSLAAITFVLSLLPFFLPILLAHQEQDFIDIKYSADLFDFAKRPKYSDSPLHSFFPKQVTNPYFTMFPGYLVVAGLFFTLTGLAGKSINKRLVLTQRAALITSATSIAYAVIWAFFLPGSYEHSVSVFTILLVANLILWGLVVFFALQAYRKQQLTFREVLIKVSLFLGFLTAALALGPELHIAGRLAGSSPFAQLFTVIPGFKSMRQVLHFNTFAILFGIIAVALALKPLGKIQRKYKYLLAVVISIVIVFEYQFDSRTDLLSGAPALENRPTAKDLPNAYQFLRNQPAHSPVVIFPTIRKTIVDKMYWSTYHWKPLLTGYSGHRPLEYRKFMNYTRNFPNGGKAIIYVQEHYKPRFLLVDKALITERQRNGKFLERARRWLSSSISHFDFLFEDERHIVYQNRNWQDEYFYNIPIPSHIQP